MDKLSDTLARRLADDYSNMDADLGQDWQRIHKDKRFDFVNQFIRDEQLELDVFSGADGVLALQDIMRVSVTGEDPLYALARVRALLHDYQPAIDKFDEEREKWINDPDNTWIGPNPDYELDAQRG